MINFPFKLAWESFGRVHDHKVVLIQEWAIVNVDSLTFSMITLIEIVFFDKKLILSFDYSNLNH